MPNFEKSDGIRIHIKFTEDIIGDPEVEMYDVGKDLGEEAYDASDEDSGHEADKAFDGDNNTYWTPGYRLTGEWVSVDLGEETLVRLLNIRSAPDARYTSWRLEGSNDNSEWDTVLESGHTDNDQPLHFFIGTETYRYWRVYGESRSGNYPGFSIIELLGGPEELASFTVTGQEPQWVESSTGELGPLQDKEYVIQEIKRPDAAVLYTDDFEQGTLDDVEATEDGLQLEVQE